MEIGVGVLGAVHDSTVEQRSSQAYVIIAYGNGLGYHYSAIFAGLLISAYKDDASPIVIYTDRPELFRNYPFQIVPISPQQISDWSLEGRYWFRIKNRVMHDVLDRGFERVLYIDSDIAFTGNPNIDIGRVTPGRAVLFRNEGRANRSPKSHYRGLAGLPKDLFADDDLVLSPSAPLWSSAVMGLHRNMRASVECADRVIRGLFGKVDTHTLEQFALGVALAKDHQVVPSYGSFSIFSTSRTRAFARRRIFEFFQRNRAAPLGVQMAEAKRLSLRQPLGTRVIGRLLELKAGPDPDFATLS
ncbi:hypothetical protein [Mesorhizobium sp. WSM4884]|uniref:hypothetical protein n=1 Tax=Mesorhizobium sp. WSM4884 TaxID=3038542 RepID=UPI00241806EB|nr:hypothetical protein [Mesorhizobium sp. WSM4884]MDG4883114.1 hypothetical protein [Mesorhizobium sp. WSM4884]